MITKVRLRFGPARRNDYCPRIFAVRNARLSAMCEDRPSDTAAESASERIFF